MSGIAVFYGGTREMAKASLSLLGHRGSRTTVLETGQKIGMGAVVSRAFDHKMSILEGDGEYVVFDGFLRNYPDAAWPEKIMELYKESGREFLNMLDGSFAFAIYTDKETIIARDPLGLKPLYYGYINGHIVCTSEMKALVPFCNEVKIFPPGHYYSSLKGLKKYSSLEDLSYQRNPS